MLLFSFSSLVNAFVCVMDDCNDFFCNMNFSNIAKKIETSFFIVTIGWQWAIHSRHSARHETEPQSDNSDTSNASIASASGSIGYGGSRVPANSICYQSSTEGPSPGDTAVSPQGKEPAGLLVATTSGSALIGLSDSDGGCINPAYDNGDGNCPTGTNDGIVVDAGEGPGAATCGESTTSSTSNENSNQTCCLSSPSFPKSKSLSTTASLKKKSSSFLHRERKKPVLTRSQVSCSFLWKLFLWFYYEFSGFVAFETFLISSLVIEFNSCFGND